MVVKTAGERRLRQGKCPFWNSVSDSVSLRFELMFLRLQRFKLRVVGRVTALDTRLVKMRRRIRIAEPMTWGH